MGRSCRALLIEVAAVWIGIAALWIAACAFAVLEPVATGRTDRPESAQSASRGVTCAEACDAASYTLSNRPAGVFAPRTGSAARKDRRHG
jgi:hypothetical protein